MNQISGGDGFSGDDDFNISSPLNIVLLCLSCYTRHSLQFMYMCDCNYEGMLYLLSFVLGEINDVGLA